MNFKKLFSNPPTETTPLVPNTDRVSGKDDTDSEMDGSDYSDMISGRESVRRQSLAADKLSMKLLAIDDDDDEAADLILQEVLNLDRSVPLITQSGRERPSEKDDADEALNSSANVDWKGIVGTICSMTTLFILAFGIIAGAILIHQDFIGPPSQPVGPYELIERQVRGKSWVASHSILMVHHPLTKISLVVRCMFFCIVPGGR